MPTPSFNSKKGFDQLGYNQDYNATHGRIATVESALVALTQKVNAIQLPSSTGTTSPTTGNTIVNQTITGITSISVVLPSDTFSVSPPIRTTPGALTGVFVTQNANLVHAGPSSGSPAVPTWRTLVAADLPAGTTPNFATGETPTGTINGVNTSFTLAHTPNPSSSVAVYMSGLRVAPSNYTVSGSTVTFTVAPAIGAVLVIDYRY